MSNWITDRKPTKKDAYKESVWLCRKSGYVDDVRYGSVILGEPWMPITPPEPYVEPKRFRVEYFEYDEEKESGRFSPGCYIMVTDFIDDDIIYNKTPLPYLTNRDAHRKAAERIAAIYEEEMP